MALKVENLTRENCELRARNGRSSTSALSSSSSSSSSAPNAGDKALRRDYELVTAEKDRLMKLIEQLKHEKKQLVETVLHLSNEVDAAHKSVDQRATDRMRHVQTDAMIRSARRRLGLQIIGVLEARGVAGDDPLMKVRACMRCLVWSGLDLSFDRRVDMCCWQPPSRCLVPCIVGAGDPCCDQQRGTKRRGRRRGGGGGGGVYAQ